MDSLPLHICNVHKVTALFNRAYIFLHSMLLIALIYYRVNPFLFHGNQTKNFPTIPWLLIFAAELLLSFLWFLNQVYGWRPVSRTAYPERLPEDKELPAIDVFVCTADPNREPTLQVMNTVLSAMALDYPPEKLNVYLSDDGGSSVTLEAMRVAWGFAKSWLPFCRKFGVKTGCPEAYFSDSEESENFERNDFVEQRQRIKVEYDEFKERVMRIRENGKKGGTSILANRYHSPVVEVIMSDSTIVSENKNREVPLLVYISREKQPTHQHNFKAGALNVLLRVSGRISNSPYILSLDCDMYCNDGSSARQAMCFHLDPKITPSLAFVQFPQKFLNISENDIYNGQWRSFNSSLYGMDGLVGPVLCGTGYYIKRKTFYRDYVREDHLDLKQLEQVFGPSKEFINSLQHNQRPNVNDGGESSIVLQTESRVLASCAYEEHTKWGEEVGFLYNCLVEDYLTSFISFHCKGWTSVYCDPPRPQFVGSAPSNLNDVLIQSSRWSAGLVDVAFSKFCPLIYGPLRMSILESMCYAQLATFPLQCLPLCCFAIVPQICLLNGIPLYPEVSNSHFTVFALIFLSSHIKHLQEIFSTGGSVKALWNEERIWMMRSVTCYVYGTLDGLKKKIGMREANFIPTNKVADVEQVQLYQEGKFDFRTSNMFLIPLVTLVLLNIISLVGGIAWMIVSRSMDKLFGQVFLSFYVAGLSYPIIEGMVVRKDKGRIPSSVTLSSAAVSVIFLALFAIRFYGHLY